MFRKILIANRGEIALRVIAACKELDIPTVAVYSEADRDLLHVRFADEAVCIGPARSYESYLNIPAIISAAEITNVDALHPGYGYLAENAHFAEVCETCGIKFIGPSADSIRLMGDKARAVETFRQLGLPTIPGIRSIDSEDDQLEDKLDQIGFPLLIKAVAGGGGRGMRIVRSADEFAVAHAAAQSEAQAAFGSPEVYLERYLDNPRHIEFQVLADEHANVVHLGERECSIQRRHQKLIEESPSLAVSAEFRAKLGGQVVEVIRQLGYTNAGTVEFLFDREGNYFFIEMNTRIQVEHPLTEMVTGLDLVKEQIRVAAGQELGFSQDNILFKGHSIECRINAESPETFVPSPGQIVAYHAPGGPGIRVDSAAYADCVISPHYDSLIAKLIAHGRDRNEAIARIKRALETFVIEGIETTIPMHRRVLDDPDFAAGNYGTSFLERFSN